MSNPQLTLDEIFENVGLTAKWEARAKEKEASAIAKNMIGLGLPFETVVSATKLDPEKVRELYTEG